MSADPAHRRQLGELLVDKGVLTEAELQQALEEQQRTGAPLGEILVRLGFSQAPTIANALAEQHGGPLRTEYGLALGPTSAIRMPPDLTEPVLDTRLSHNASAQPAAEADPTIAQLTTALEERTAELERVRISLAMVEHNEAELATAKAQVEKLQGELAAGRVERTDSQPALDLAEGEHQAELAAINAELSSERRERDRLERQLAQARARHVEAADALIELGLDQERQEAELVATKAELANAQVELGRHEQRLAQQAEAQNDEAALTHHALRELHLAREQLDADLAATKAELAEEQQERAQLEQQLEQAQARNAQAADALRAFRLADKRNEAELVALRAELATEQEQRVGLERPVQAEVRQEGRDRPQDRQDGDASTHHTVRDLALALEQHKAELGAMRAELTKSDEMQTRQTDRAYQLEKQLEQERQHALVAAARARAQRRYGPALRAQSIQETSGADESPNPFETLAGVGNANTEDVHERSGITIRLWQLALFVVLVPTLLYLLVPINPLLATAAVVFIAAVLVASGLRAGRAARSGSPRAAAPEPPASS